MPYKSGRIKIEGTKHDRRIKLTDKDREKIKKLHEEGVPIREITRRFKVDRRLIQFTLFPERMERNRKLRAERGGWKQYYDREEHRESVKDHRRYKQKLALDGKIKEPTSARGC